jgi:hypothetical protein
MLPVTEVDSQALQTKTKQIKCGPPLAPLIEKYLLQQERVNTVTAI